MDIIIPQGSSDNFGAPISQLVSYVNQCINDKSGLPVHFDFSNVKFANPLLLCGISAFYDQLVESGIEVNFTIGEGINSYLDTIGFYKGINPYDYSIDDLVSKLQQFNSKTYFPITQFPASSTENSSLVREKTISAILKIIKNQLNLSGQVLEAIYYFINELTQNVSDHSKADYGKIMAQYYNSKGYMDICIVDGGKGLFQSYLDNNKKFPISHSEAIEFAFSGESTKYSENDSSRGFGLQTSRRMLVDGLEGQFFYWSGDAFLMNKGDIGNLPYWKGCYAGLRIPISEPKGFNFYNFLE